MILETEVACGSQISPLFYRGGYVLAIEHRNPSILLNCLVHHVSEVANRWKSTFSATFEHEIDLI
jgi:hypothetical protein